MSKRREYFSPRFGAGYMPNVLKKAVQFGLNKKIVSIDQFNALQDSNKRLAFSAAGDLTDRALTQILKSANGAIANGLSFDQFKKNLSPGLIDRIAAPEVVFKNQAIETYQRSRFNQQTRLKPLRPFLQYITFGDDRVRPNHALMNGVVAEQDSSFWANNYPPNGHQCRCVARALNERQVAEGKETVYKTQEEVNRAKLKEQAAAGVPENKRVLPIADAGGWRTSFKPGELELEKIRQTYNQLNPNRFKSVLTPQPVTPAKIEAAAATLKETPREDIIKALQKRAAVTNIEDAIPTSSIVDTVAGFDDAAKISSEVKLRSFSYEYGKEWNGYHTGQYSGGNRISRIAINKENAIKREAVQKAQNARSQKKIENYLNHFEEKLIGVKDAIARFEAGERLSFGYLKWVPSKKDFAWKYADTKIKLNNALKSITEDRDIYKTLKRWSVSQQGGKGSQVYKTSAHEYFHAVSFQADTRREFSRRLTANNVSSLDKAKISEYATYYGNEETFAETGAALVAGIDVPENLKKAFEETIEAARGILK